MFKTNKIRISGEVTQKLRRLKGATGLTPNIISRIAICLSLKEKKTHEVMSMRTDGQEFNRYTLFGDFEPLIFCLVKQYLIDSRKEADSEEKLIEELRYHLTRGVNLLNPRVKGINDIAQLALKI